MEPSFKFVRVRDVHVPTRANQGDAGIDLYVPNYLKVDELLALSSKSSSVRISDALYDLTECDSEFKTKFNQLLSETKQRLQKEFDEL